MNDDLKELIEQLADAEHASWSRWMAHLFTKGEHHEDGSFTLPGGYVEALQRQITTPYADLSEQEREYDREEVRHILPLIVGYARPHLMQRFSNGKPYIVGYHGPAIPPQVPGPKPRA